MPTGKMVASIRLADLKFPKRVPEENANCRWRFCFRNNRSIAGHPYLQLCVERRQDRLQVGLRQHQVVRSATSQHGVGI